MRRRFMQGGISSFASHEALELLLFYAIPRKNVNPIAHALLDHFGSLSALLEAKPEQLMQVPGIGESAAVLVSLILPIVRMAEKEQLGNKPIIKNFREAKDYCRQLFDGMSDEVLYVICLDAQGRVIRAVRALTGTIDEITIYPRVILNAALTHGAHSIVLAHNHPSGVTEPSDADLRTTDQLREMLGAVGVPLLDHIVYANRECISIEQWRSEQKTMSVPPAIVHKAADKKVPSRKTGAPPTSSKNGGRREKEADGEGLLL